MRLTLTALQLAQRYSSSLGSCEHGGGTNDDDDDDDEQPGSSSNDDDEGCCCWRWGHWDCGGGHRIADDSITRFMGPEKS